jgi:hypothetical protein
MKKLRLTRQRQLDFLRHLAETGNVSKAVALAGTSRTRVYALRQKDRSFTEAWDEAEEIACDRLEEEARRRALEGVEVPVVSAGRVVRGDDGHPLVMRRYSDTLLLALLRARRPEEFGKRRSTELSGPSSGAMQVDLRALLIAKLAQRAQHATEEEQRLLTDDPEDGPPRGATGKTGPRIPES